MQFFYRLLIAGISFYALLSHAHIEQTLLTSIAYNPRTQKIEVIHQIYAHDIEHAFGNRIQSEGGLDDIRTQAMVGVELAETFKLWSANGEAIPLALVGAELEAEFFYIYQETDLPALPPEIGIEHGMLRNYWPDMQNYLNVDYGTFIKSLIFSHDDGLKTITDD